MSQSYYAAEQKRTYYWISLKVFKRSGNILPASAELQSNASCLVVTNICCKWKGTELCLGKFYGGYILLMLAFCHFIVSYFWSCLCRFASEAECTRSPFCLVTVNDPNHMTDHLWRPIFFKYTCATFCPLFVNVAWTHPRLAGTSEDTKSFLPGYFESKNNVDVKVWALSIKYI